MSNRLFVDSIVSIGAVESADNPESSIVLWKSAGSSSDPKRGGGPGSCSTGSVPRPTSPEAMAKAVTSKLDRQTQALEEITDDYRTLRQDIQTMKGTEMGGETMTAAGIADAVAKRAAALRSEPKFWDKTEAELRVDVWKRTPGLRDAYSAAMRDPDDFEKSETGEHSAALTVARRWSDDPATGL